MARALVGSVHYTDSEKLSKQIFTSARYNVPLFVCKRAGGVPVGERDDLQVTSDGRRKLLKRMTNYGQLPNWKGNTGLHLHQEKRRQIAFHTPFKSCQKSLRNGHKEWTLAPNRYLLGGNIFDLASKSTGSKGPYQCFTGPRFTSLPIWSEKQRKTAAEEIDPIHIPAEMDRLAHPARYFVGSIRPGDNTKQRPHSRLAISQPTLCWRNPLDPAPNRYFKGIFDISTGTRAQKPLFTLPPSASVHHSYCAEPFRRPPPGRYQLDTRVPAPVPRSWRKAPTTGPGPHRLAFTLNPYWNPYRQPATLRMHTVDIPLRRRKRGRNMKVAFGSGVARFKDQEFFPIGALVSVLPKDGGGVNHKIVSTTPTAAAAVEKEPSIAGEEQIDPWATLSKTRTKLFVIPRRHQTRRLSGVPSSAGIRNGTGYIRRTSGMKVAPVQDGFGDGGSSIIEAEILMTKASSEDLTKQET